jgi:heat shock protein HslJ
MRTRTRSRPLPALLASSLVLLGGCVPNDRPSERDRENPMPSSPAGSWRLETVDARPIGSGSQLVLTLGADGTAGGQVDCNTIFGSWRLEDGNRLVLSQMASTLIGCLAADDPRTETFLAAMVAGNTFTLDGTRMEVSAGGAVGRFQRSGP